MTKIPNSKQYDLEERTLEFAQSVRIFVRKLPRTIGNIEDAKQLIRSSGSIGANYIEANEALGKKDFVFRLRISRKEAKETKFWLHLVDVRRDLSLEEERQTLLREATELLYILSAMINKVKT